MPRNAAAWIAALLGAATLFWLGYSVGRVQSLADQTRLERDADTDRYTLSGSGLLVDFERLGGAGKPLVRSGDGVELLDLSDWDRDSRIVVDGSLFELVRLYPQSSVDYARNRIGETLNGDGWLLQREITLASDGTLDVQHLFIARKPIRRVDLALAHVHQAFLELHVDETSVTGVINRLTADQLAAGVQDPPTYRISVTAAADSPPIRFREGGVAASGPSSFVVDMAADQPARDTRVMLGHERIRVEPATAT